MRVLLKGGTVVSGTGTKKLDILTEDGRIAQVAENLHAEDARVVDVTGKLIFIPVPVRRCAAVPPQ